MSRRPPLTPAQPPAWSALSTAEQLRLVRAEAAAAGVDISAGLAYLDRVVTRVELRIVRVPDGPAESLRARTAGH